jgi:hypothetical protein
MTDIEKRLRELHAPICSLTKGCTPCPGEPGECDEMDALRAADELGYARGRAEAFEEAARIAEYYPDDDASATIAKVIRIKAARAGTKGGE